MDIWAKVEALKKKHDWSDHDLAKALGRDSKSYLYNIRKGIGSPSAEVAFKLAQLLAEERLVRGEAQKNAAIVAFLDAPVAEAAAS